MNRQNYNNSMRMQVMSLPDLVDGQLSRCFNEEKLKSLMTVAEIFNERHIIISGCGDSYAASGVMQGVLDSCSDAFGCKVLPMVEFSRFTPIKDIGIGEPDSPLVIMVSIGGTTSRLVEALMKCDETSALTLLVTNKNDTPASKAADRVFYLDIPEGARNIPGLRTYFGSLIGIAAIACRIGYVRGVLEPQASIKWQEAIHDYVHKCEGFIKEFDDQMLELANRWKHINRFNFIGDGANLFSANFCMDKFFECSGSIGTYDDSENWCHVDIYLNNPNSVGTIFFVDNNVDTFGRIKESVQNAITIGRPVLVVTNDRSLDFNGAHVCRLPVVPNQYEWLFPMTNFIPVALLAGYHSALNGHKYFNSYDEKTDQIDMTSKYFFSKYFTNSNSKIEIHVD